MCLQTSAMADAAICLMLSLIVINTIHVCVLQTSVMAEAAISLLLSLIVINNIHVCLFADISHGRGRYQPDVRVSYLPGIFLRAPCSALSTHVLSSLSGEESIRAQQRASRALSAALHIISQHLA